MASIELHRAVVDVSRQDNTTGRIWSRKPFRVRVVEHIGAMVCSSAACESENIHN